VRAVVGRIGLYRVAAILIGCALVLEIIRMQLVTPGSWGVIACTVAEIAFLAMAAGVFVTARRAG
jgi:hypothetical protein